MKKAYTILLAGLLLFSFSSLSNAQALYIGIGGGVSAVQSPDNWTKDINDGGLGFSTGYHFGAKGKLSLPIIPITPVVFVNYHMFSSDDSGIEYSGNILSIGVGGEIGLLPGPLSPYLGLDVMYNNFGEFEQKTPAGTFTTDGYSRIGLGIGVGAEFTLLPMINLDASVKYNFMNLAGKEDTNVLGVTVEEESVNFITLNVSVFFSGM